MLNVTRIRAFFKNFQGTQKRGVLAKIFKKTPKIFFVLQGMYAGAMNLKKFGFLDLPLKFHQNPWSRSWDTACFWQGVLSKKSTFRLRTHISLRVLVPNLLLKELKIDNHRKLFPLVGCCGPNGSGVMAAQSWLSSPTGTPRPVFFEKS